MYKYKLRTKNKKTLSESVRESNNLQSLINEVNTLKNVSFIIFKNYNNQLMIKGVK